MPHLIHQHAETAQAKPSTGRQGLGKAATAQLQLMQRNADESPRSLRLQAMQRAADASFSVRPVNGTVPKGSVVQCEFTSAGSRSTHYAKHGSEFGAADEAGYETASETLYSNRSSHQSKKSGGKTYVYDSGTNTIGVYTSAGKTITFFKPGRGQSYYDDQ